MFQIIKTIIDRKNVARGLTVSAMILLAGTAMAQYSTQYSAQYTPTSPQYRPPAPQYIAQAPKFTGPASQYTDAAPQYPAAQPVTTPALPSTIYQASNYQTCGDQAQNTPAANQTLQATTAQSYPATGSFAPNLNRPIINAPTKNISPKYPTAQVQSVPQQKSTSPIFASTKQENPVRSWMPNTNSQTKAEEIPAGQFDSVQPNQQFSGSPPIVVEPSCQAMNCGDIWSLQFMPDGLIYRSYMAGAKEPRFASQWVYDQNEQWLWDVSLGGRVGLVRYGSQDPLFPEGTQLDIEGAAMLRLDPEHERDLVACDYRFGIPLTFGHENHRLKLAYYHLSSHLGDEYIERNPEVNRINYVRDAMVVGYSIYLWQNQIRLYTEAAYAFNHDGGAEPWEFQFGIEYTAPQPTGWRPVPFIAIGGHIREENDYSGNVVAQAGWLWRGNCGQTFRMGMQCYAGMSDQYEFYDQYENKVGFGLWYDF
jgi:Protein of unknown function (DUF1207)